MRRKWLVGGIVVLLAAGAVGAWMAGWGGPRSFAAPGLGIELDRAALAQLHEQYKACGLTERNDEIEMQKVQPDWKFMATRW